MTLKRKIKIAPEKRKRKGKLISKNVPIRLRVSYARNRVELFSGFRTDLEDWNENTSRVKDKRVNEDGQSSDEINLSLDHYENELNKFFLSYSVGDIIPTQEEVKEFFEKIRFGERPKTMVKEIIQDELSFFEVFDEFTSYTGRINNWTEDTYTKYKTIKNHLINFNKSLEFDDLTEIGLSDLLIYFMDTKGFRNETTKRYMEFVKVFLRYALKQRHTTNDAFLSFNPKIKRVKKAVIFLTEDELKLIRDTKIPENKNYLKNVRDVLLFLCYSGLRHSDALQLRKFHIRNEKIDLTTIKTYDDIKVELNNVTKSIINKYSDDLTIGKKIIPVISNQKTNEYLKELGELVGLDEPINQTYYIGNRRYDELKPKYERMSSHIGRKTFICLCIAKGIPIQVIMKWTGHTDYKSMLPYIDVSEKTKEIEMEKLNF